MLWGWPWSANIGFFKIPGVCYQAISGLACGSPVFGGYLEIGRRLGPTAPANIESRVTRMRLPGGLKLVLLPKKTRGRTVAAAATLRFGGEKSLFGKGMVALMAGDLLMRGTTHQTPGD
ncbi:MAG: hypothetical protein LAP40_05445 [Acidobacteriia bacterium]|nr:hypothetical protein [Terriglobia bacterium]